MGSLTPFLQDRFAQICPTGWSCRPEVAVLPPDVEKVLGFSPRADVLLEKDDKTKQLWIEFEVSRADPVANHAKFATSHLFSPLVPHATFVSMVSPHIVRGRRNLASATVHLMRRLAMNSYQTVLLPNLTPKQIQQLNQLSVNELFDQQIAIEPEWERVQAITEPVFHAENVRVHLAGDLLDVMLSLRRWNLDIATKEGRASWVPKRSTIQYFVHDPATGQFAPCKFCAYLPFAGGDVSVRREMAIDLYTQVEATAPLFDGRVAWSHLAGRLAFRQFAGEAISTPLQSALDAWVGTLDGAVRVHPRGATILQPPAWFL